MGDSVLGEAGLPFLYKLGLSRVGGHAYGLQPEQGYFFVDQLKPFFFDLGVIGGGEDWI